MKAATRLMMDRVSYQGGFVWQYLPDCSRSWGELEARRSMVWIQPMGTPSVGLVLVEAYESTKDRFYLKAALQVAKTLIKGQLPCGGWNYVFDLQGEDSLKTWYETVGKNAWRLEEFQHYYGNATFDDGGTIESGLFLLQLHQATKDKTVEKALEKVNPDSGKPLFVHRKGSNVVNGRYFADQDIRKTLAHYSSVASFDLNPIWNAYEQRSVLEERNEKSRTFNWISVESILKNFDSKGFWPSPMTSISHPYQGAGPSEGSQSEDHAETMVGDRFDTSCYPPPMGQTCISTGYYIRNMQRLIDFLKSENDLNSGH